MLESEYAFDSTTLCAYSILYVTLSSSITLITIYSLFEAEFCSFPSKPICLSLLPTLVTGTTIYSIP